MKSLSDFERAYFSGQKLYGDDFNQTQIDQWFKDEEHGYAELHGSDQKKHAYGYEELNVLHGFSRLKKGSKYRHVLGFGSNFGDELMPILAQCESITLLDSSSRFEVADLRGVPVRYIIADPTGRINLPDGSVDLITCFGVLHHIPNISFIVSEFARVLMPGGVVLVREPITTMGDWRNRRRGLTLRERGIPQDLFLKIFKNSDLQLDRVADCYFPPWVRLCSKFGLFVFSNRIATVIDALFSIAFRFNYSYHRGGTYSRFAPASLFVVASKAHR